ncbi:MAG: DUF115 domain-containing protein [Lachnospiraceae bacterium]|nr:DUF115 domain-containing protein [Lachnospiraceae bacterium]
MALDFIEQIYADAYLTTRLKQLSCMCKGHKRNNVYSEWNILTEDIAGFCRKYLVVNSELSERIWDEFQKISSLISNGQFSEVADEIDQIIPYMYDAISINGSVDVSENGYTFFSSASGFLSVNTMKTGKDIYSKVDPVWEKRQQAISLYNPRMLRFCVLGCGLGYLAWQMYEISNHSVDIYIYDNDRAMLKYAEDFGVLDRIPAEKLHIITNSSMERLLGDYSEQLDYFKDDKAVLFIEDYMMDKASGNEKSIMEKLYSMIQTGIDYKDIQTQNHFRNKMNVGKSISDIEWDKFSSDWIIIGGGPSLDERISYIKDNREKRTILAASTVYKKLIMNDIKPDFVAVIDPQNRTYNHVRTMTDQTAPIIMTDTANWQFGECYKGEKYLVETSGSFYSQNNEKWYSSGTVVAFAIDVAAYAGAKKIELIGVDLSYPTGESHAKDTMDYKEVKADNLIMVPSVNGEMVYTDFLMKIYIDEISAKVNDFHEIEFVNLSPYGALINGCK